MMHIRRARSLIRVPGLCQVHSARQTDSVYDVVILGGGIVGNTLASALASFDSTRKLRVALLESKPFNTIPATLPVSSPPSIRTSAISHASRDVFERVGAWSHVLKRRATPYTDMQVWHHLERGRIHWSARERLQDEITRRRNENLPEPDSSQQEKEQCLGYIVENDIITSALRDAIDAHQQTAELSRQPFGLTLISPAKVDSVQPAAATSSTIDGVSNSHSPSALTTLHLHDGRTLTTRLLVGADGPGSIVKKAAGIGSWGWDYQQSGVVITVATDQPHSTAWQRFLPSGPIALLPCHGNFSSIVWTTTPDHSRFCLKQDLKSLVKDINAAFRAAPAEFQAGGRPSALQQLLPKSLYSLLPVLFPDPSQTLPPVVTEIVDVPQAFPLRFIHSSAYVAPRTVLIGDAAHVIHPQAGQGVNLGIQDAFALADVIRQAIYAGDDLGSTALLVGWERSRSAANLAIMAGVDNIGRMFGIRDGPFAVARSIGMDVFNAVPAVKYMAAEAAIGGSPFRTTDSTSA